MKKLLILLLLAIQSVLAKPATDTITTWKLYKDAKIILEGNEVEKPKSVTIKKSDRFKELKLTIYSDTPRSNVRRKLLFKLNGKLIATSVRILKESRDAFAISKEELLRYIGSNINKTFTIEYTDNTGTQGTVIAKIIVTDK